VKWWQQESGKRRKADVLPVFEEWKFCIPNIVDKRANGAAFWFIYGFPRWNGHYNVILFLIANLE
jgi:hypothetical protein